MAKGDLLKAFARAIQTQPTKYSNLSLSTVNKHANMKFTVTSFNFNFEVQFNRPDLVKEAQEMARDLKENPQIRFLMYFMVLFLRQRDLNNTNLGGASFFLLHCIVLAFFRFHKMKITQARGQTEASNALLSEYCLKMLEFYGLHFDCAKQKIVLGEGGKIVEKTSKDTAFSLVCPSIDSTDLGTQAFRVKELFNCLKNRYFFLTNYNFVNGESVLKYLLNPSKINFSTYLK